MVTWFKIKIGRVHILSCHATRGVGVEMLPLKIN